MLPGETTARLFYSSQSARQMPTVLQVAASIDFNARSLSIHVELSTRAGHRAAIDWLLRLDLATSPPVHEQWHGQAHPANGQVEVDVRPRHWPTGSERWFMNLWMRDPNGRPDWDLVDTRALL